MTTFNPKNKKSLTYGEALDPAMNITDESDALQYLKQYVSFIQMQLDSGEASAEGKTAEEIAKINLGYYADYYSNETRQRIEKLFNCSHPVFGSIKLNGAPSTEQALEAGNKMATS